MSVNSVVIIGSIYPFTPEIIRIVAMMDQSPNLRQVDSRGRNTIDITAYSG